MARDHRRLAAIVSLDVVGYSRLMGVDESGTLAALKAHRRELIDPKIAEHDGRIVKSTGDGLLLEFSSVVDAVRCAVEVQRGMAERNADVAPDKRLDFRIGINVGDIIIDGDDIFGDGVNVAARLEGLADPGGICVSRVVRDQVLDKLSFTFDDLGTQQVKNIARPVDVYRIDLGGIPLAHRLGRDTTGAPAAPSSASPAPSPAAHGLPADRTPLIGRETEITACTARLRETRLLTLTGLGGTGKTRLAIALARGCAGAHRDGTAFVDLAPVNEPERVSAAVAAATRVDERPGMPLLDVIAEQLATRELLLVLDNCEHVLESAAALADALIGRCAALRLVATSREPLGVDGEVVHAVPPLTLPPDTEDVGDLAASEAVRLFVSRAQRAMPSFVLDASNAQAVARICRRLDGVPLALELAAARVALLGVAKIADRLDQRFRLLTGGRDRRQQTLETVVRWSWDHLAADEQRLLAALSVFAGSFALETAVAVAAAGDEFEMLDGLARLHTASLLVVDAGDGDARYRMLDTVREFARQRLDELRQTDAARDRHLVAFVARAEATKNLHDARWHAIFRTEVEDFVAAHAWCDRAADGGLLGLRLALALRRKWINSGMLQLGQRIMQEALARPDAQDPALRGWVLFGLGLLRYFGGDRTGAISPIEEAEAIGRALDLPALVSRALGMRSDILPVSDRDLQKMKAMAAEAVAIARTLPPPDGSGILAAGLMAYGNNSYWLDELEAAEAAYQEGFEISMRLGDLPNSCVPASNIVDAKTRGGTDRGVRQLLLHIAGAEAETRSSHVAKLLIRGCMQLALHRKLWCDALLLHAAEKALALEVGLDPEPLADIPAKLAAARAALGAEAADRAQAAGAALAYGAALAHARAWLAQQPD